MQIAPAELPVALDRGLFQQHFAKLLENAAQDGGIEGYLAALGAKQHAYAALIERSGGGLTLDDFESLLDLVFTARRRVFPALGALGAAQVTARVSELLCGQCAAGAAHAGVRRCDAGCGGHGPRQHQGGGESAARGLGFCRRDACISATRRNIR